MSLTGKKPRAVVCYICGKEYGTKKIESHVAQCELKWNTEQEALDPEQRRPCPQAPPGFFNIIRGALGKPLIHDEDKQPLLTEIKRADGTLPPRSDE